MNEKKWLWIGLGGLVAWYVLFKTAAPEPTGQVDPQTGETAGSVWDILGLLGNVGSISMD